MWPSSRRRGFAPRVRRGAGLDVAARERLVDVAAPQAATVDDQQHLVDEHLAGLLGERRSRSSARYLRRPVRGAVLVDGQRRATGRRASREVDGVLSHLRAWPGVAVDVAAIPRAVASARLGDAGRGRGMEWAGRQVTLHVRHQVAGWEATPRTPVGGLDALERDSVAARRACPSAYHRRGRRRGAYDEDHHIGVFTLPVTVAWVTTA